MNPAADMPTISGYVLKQVVGHGGMATVFAATQTATNQNVAIKFLPASKEVEDTFLAAARLHKSLKHPNIASVFDFGSTESGCYLVSEFLPDGDLGSRLERGIHIQALIKIIKDMARALDYAHAVGVVHRDVKPENILFRANGEAVLTDFGIAQQVTTQPSKSALGTVIGTPEYMSPEQAAGRAIDGRSDLYSLGIVLFRMLTGDLPFKADTAVSIGIKHLQEPVPRLPNYLRTFQPVIDKALAKKPEQRFQRGEDLVDMLDSVRSNNAIPESTIRTQNITTREIMAVGGDLLSTPHDSARQKRLSLRIKRRRQLRGVAISLVLLAGISSLAYVGYERSWFAPERVLSQLGIGEDPLLADALSEARSLRQDPNQGLTAIVAGYRRVLAIEPDHKAAQSEVAGLTKDWMQSIDDALLAGNLEQAASRLSEASTVFPDNLQTIQLDIQLQNRQRAERLMVSAQALLSSNGLSDLPSATAAIQSFQEVVRLAPEHEGARQALRELAVHYAELARSAAYGGEVTVAINLLERATAADNQLTELDDVRKLISKATTAQAAIDDLLQQARRYRADNQLIKPPGENAAELYHRVLATDPDNIFAAQGLDEVSARITASADQLLADGQLEETATLVTQAAAVGMSDEVVNEIRRRLETQKEKLETVASNLANAEKLLEMGYLTAPAGNNAVTYLREIQQLDPGNVAASTLLRQCAERLADVAQEAYAFGLVEPAEQYLELALTITPEVSEWVALRDSWEGSQE